MGQLPRAAVIIPNLDSPVVDRAVDAVCAQVGAVPLAILVVGLDRPGRLRGDGRVRLVETDGPRLPGAARNIGVAHAPPEADVFVFVDADCVPEPAWLAAHLRRQAAGETVVGGAVLYDADNYWMLADNLSMFHACDAALPAGPRDFLPTLNLSVRRAAWDAAGPIDPELPRGEDLDWTIRLARTGHRPYFDPAARLWHRPVRATARAMWDHWYESGRWMTGVRQRHPEVFGGRAWVYHPWLLRLLSPAIAAVATLRLYLPGRPGARHPRTLPAVYATKLAWCWGAARPALRPAPRRGPITPPTAG